MSELFSILFLFGFIIYCVFMAKPNLIKKSRKTISKICLPVLVILFVLMGMNAPKPEVKTTTNKVVIESEPAFKILSDEKYGTEKRTVKVLLDEKATEKQLEQLAYKIKKMNSETFKRTFIMYEVKNVEMDSAWATTHFDPNLKITIWDDLANKKTS